MDAHTIEAIVEVASKLGLPAVLALLGLGWRFVGVLRAENVSVTQRLVDSSANAIRQEIRETAVDVAREAARLAHEAHGKADKLAAEARDHEREDTRTFLTIAEFREHKGAVQRTLEALDAKLDAAIQRLYDLKRDKA